MAYAQQYNFQMLNDQGTLVEVQIFSNGYSGGVTTLIGGSQPVVIEYNAVSDRTQGIRDSTCTLNMISQAGFDLSTIYTTDERQYRVDVYYNASLYWTGFVTQDFSQEPFMEIGTYEVQIIARCGLVGLQGFKFLNASGYYLFGYITMTQLLAILFAKTGLALNFVVAMNIYETRMNTANCAFDQMYVNTQRFFGSDGLPMQCSDILEAVCQAFGLIVFQRLNYWWVARQYEMPTVRFYTYSPSGVYAGGPGSYVFGSNYGPSYTLQMINGDQMIGYDQGWQEVKQNYTFAYLLTAIPDSSFYAWSSPALPVYWDISSWSGAGNKPVKSTVLSHGMRIPNSVVVNSQYAQSLGIQVLAGDTLGFSIEIDNSSDTNYYPYNILIVDSSSGQHWLNVNSSTGAQSWTTTQPSTPNLAIGGGAYASYSGYGVPGTSTVNPGSIIYKLINNLTAPAGGTLYLRLYNSNSGAGVIGTVVNSVQIYKVDPKNLSGSSSALPTAIGLCFDVTQTAATYSFMPNDKEILIGDAASDLYAGALCLDTAGTVTATWNRFGVSESRLLLDIVTSTLMDLHKRTYREFSGSTYGIMYYGDCWKIQGLAGSNYYVPTGLSIDLKNMQGSMSGTEHDTTTSVYSDVITILYNKDPQFQS